MQMGIPTACLYNLVSMEKKSCPTKGSAHHIHFDKTMHDIFRFIQSQKCASVNTCKLSRAFSIEGHFNKINNFIFN